jgi:LPS-assembly protein
VQLGSQFRYLNEAFGGIYRSEALFEYLPHDRLADRDRWGVAVQHTQATANGFSGTVNYNRVSDNDYYTDLSSRVTSTSPDTAAAAGDPHLRGWRLVDGDGQCPVFPDPGAGPQESGHQAVSSAAADHTSMRGSPTLYATDSSFFGQYTSFVHPDNDMVEGQRTVLQPQISVPFVTPGGM